MEQSFSSKRPLFNQFRDWFIEEVNRHTRNQVKDPFMPWRDVGGEETREKIIESFMRLLETRYGFRPVFKERLNTLDGSVESVVIRIYHVFSTMLLVDHINEKMYKPGENKPH
ncbi:hypothetical protein IT084_03300 [Desulfallas sp. Bu1-1]|uniref:hypothetical protein n=1 Tax=Desulfallas sp. Bu1-1 TaxID=2787620 RepID=UPI00189D0A33|nr:hypothetical protein [Desulfallas sp. Bu1-1]MBF7082000.1 hypothetical protein [Desulfallas sp. Bu1-1]